uniref:Tyr recombinase domain-containing protein n=1 Tax=Strigamia maritima TaxID=126957 RepID=T1IK54_STRMM
MLARYEDDKISAEPAKLVEKSWKSSTAKSYDKFWGNWCKWTNEESLNSFRPSPTNLANFLSFLFKSGLSYSSINCHRSAISQTLSLDGSPKLGFHILVRRTLKDMIISKPPQNRISTIWNVGPVFIYLESIDLSSTSSWLLVNVKVSCLLVLCLADRSSDLRLLSSDITFYDNSCHVLLTGTRKLGSQNAFIINKFSNLTFAQWHICIFTSILRLAADLQTRNNFFLGLSHNPVTTVIIARWIKTALARAGGNTAIFSAHSKRTASTSHAYKKGLDLAHIIKAADWSTARIFHCHYNRQIEPFSQDFSSTVLSGYKQP